MNNMQLLFRKIFLLIIGSFVASVSYANNVIALSDIHFNPYAACHQTPCYLIQQLNQAPASQWPVLLTQQQHQPIADYGSDTNVVLLNSALAALKQQALQDHPHFVLVLGDFLAHSYQDQYIALSGDTDPQDYQAFVDKTLHYLSAQLQQTFGTIPVYVAVGNNDSDAGDYSVLPDGVFFNKMAADFAPLVDPVNRATFKQQFATAGYYAVTIPEEPHHRLIVLNTVLFSPRVAGISDAHLKQAVTQELQWLQQQLNDAKSNHDQVWIVVHIPPGIDAFSTVQKTTLSRLRVVNFWDPIITDQFLRLLQRYPEVVTAIFAGHMHHDTFGVVGNTQQPLGTLTVVPAISPIFGNNPGYKVYQFDANTFTLQDYQTYYLNLKNNTKANWQKEYDFNQIYPHSSSDLSDNIQTLIQSEQLLAPRFAEPFQRFYGMSSASEIQKIHKHWLYYWCGLNNTTASLYQVCYVSP